MEDLRNGTCDPRPMSVHKFESPSAYLSLVPPLYIYEAGEISATMEAK